MHGRPSASEGHCYVRAVAAAVLAVAALVTAANAVPVGTTATTPPTAQQPDRNR